MSSSPFSLSPGPERRQRLNALGINVGLDDYTDAELEALDEGELEAALDEAMGTRPSRAPLD